MTTILSDETLILSTKGPVKIKNYKDELIKTDKGFFKIEIIKSESPKQYVKVIPWAFSDPLVISSDSIAVGTSYKRCLDLGGLGICRPWNRCWNQCPDNHPNKLHFINVKDLSFREIRKRGHLIIPTNKYLNITYSHNDKPTNNQLYIDAFEMSQNYKDNSEDIPLLDFEWYLNSDPLNFKSFMLGWQAGMGQTKLDSWNYFLILRNKKLALQVQALFIYFGIPCAVEPYKSLKHGENNWAVIWCKNKKPFHYKNYIFDQQIYAQIKKWTPINIFNEKINWVKIKMKDKSIGAKYFYAPFTIKFSD